MNKNAKKAYDLIHDLAKYEVNDVVYKTYTIRASDGEIFSIIEAYCVGPDIEVDYYYQANEDHFDFRYYSRFGKCIGNEKKLFRSAQEAVDNEILHYKNKLENYQNTRMQSDSEKVKEQTIKYYNDCIEKWQSITDVDGCVRYVDFIGE